MPGKARPASSRVDLRKHLGPEGGREYDELLAMLRETQGRFALMPTRSDFPVTVREALLKRLKRDLRSIPLCVVPLTWSSSWDAVRLLCEASAKLPKDGVIVLTGLDMTEGVVSAPGDEEKRPPALAVLNHGRESLHRHCRHPLVLWIDDATLRALSEHAPDFLDHFTGLFRFKDAKPASAVPFTVGVGDTRPSRTGAIEPGRSSWAASLAFYEERVAKYEKPTVERARALIGLAKALRDVRDARVAVRLSKAEILLREALEILSPDLYATDWADATNQLGVTFGEQPIGNRSTNVSEAIACFRAALRVYTEPDFPADWARTQNNLGNAYADLPTGDRGANLSEAIACYRAALRVYTEPDFPADWARTQNNLGTVYADLPTGDRGANLSEAIACYRAALRVYTESDFPADWAMAQNNLGIAYRNLSTGDRRANLSEAITCFNAALQICSESDFPALWAMAQNNLGITYGDLPTGDRGADLSEAIAHLNAALRIRTEAEFPGWFGETQFNLGLVLIQSGNMRSAICAFDASRRGYLAVGMTRNVRYAEDELKAAENALLALYPGRR